MPDPRSELERQLLRDPADVETRRRYAERLLEEGEVGASLEQWNLVIRAQPGRAGDHLHAAECCVGTGDSVGVRRHLEQARACSDLDSADPRLAQLEREAGVQNLRVLAGGRGGAEAKVADVVSISASDTVRFADVVGMHEVKKLLRLRIIEPFVNPGLFQRFRKRTGGGVLLYGPPGCGKTLMARAIATECRASFTAVGISDILNLWLGASEQNLAALFEKARHEAPSVLFFDELDALAFSRSKARSDHTRTLVNEFLNQLDGMSGRNERVLVLAATNMPWDVDEAMKRPGRFDRQIFVPPPDAEARSEMLRAKLTGIPSEALDLDRLAARMVHFSGADVDGVIENAKDAVLADILATGTERRLGQHDLESGIEETHASTLEWLKTARNLVKFGGGGDQYRGVEQYLRSARLY